jgi:TonB family protein
VIRKSRRSQAVAAMSITPVFADNSSQSLERRLHARQQVTALAYLDIGAENGGIVLNLSEEGMALQAVAPLNSQADVTLRIQLPHSQSRIETGAKIVWLSQSNRQAGVRFEDMSAEARTQIHEWIRSQATSVSSSAAENAAAPPVAEKETPRKPEKAPEYRRDKWLSLMEELEVSAPSIDAQPSMPPAAKTSRGDPPTTEAPGRSLHTPEIVLNPFGQRARPGLGSGLGSRLEEEHPDSSQVGPVEAGSGNQAEPDGGYATAAATPVKRDTLDNHSVLDWPNRVAPIVPTAASEVIAGPTASASASGSALASAGPPATTPDLAVSSDALTRSVRASLVGATQKHTPKWIGIAAVFVTFSILCFGIGAWIGSLRNSGPPVPAVATPASPSLATEPAGDAVRKRSGKEAKREAKTEAKAENVEKSRTTTSHGSTPHNGKLSAAPSTNSQIILPVHQQAPLLPTKPSFTVVTATKPPQNTSPPAPAPDDSSGASSASKMVDGRVLRPTDRFNPCHLTYRVEPAYPVEAQQQRIEGSVKIHLSISAEGSVQSAKLISGPSSLTSAAMDAAKYWRYMPALLNGEPVATEQDVEIDFRLPH